MRDIRIYIVGGEPVVGIVKWAQQPLTDDQIKGKVLPGQENFYSAQARGRKTLLEGGLQDRLFAAARQACQLLGGESPGNKELRSAGIPGVGLGSIDFLLASDGTPLVVDFDLFPQFYPDYGINEMVAQSLAEYLAYLSGDDRKVMMIGLPDVNLVDEPFFGQVMRAMKGLLPAGRVVFKESGASLFNKFLHVGEWVKTTGRNEPCPCGSGVKFKACCHQFVAIKRRLDANLGQH